MILRELKPAVSSFLAEDSLLSSQGWSPYVFPLENKRLKNLLLVNRFFSEWIDEFLNDEHRRKFLLHFLRPKSGNILDTE